LPLLRMFTFVAIRTGGFVAIIGFSPIIAII
jgi:hypothetical protein